MASSEVASAAESHPEANRAMSRPMVAMPRGETWLRRCRATIGERRDLEVRERDRREGVDTQRRVL